jgi:hypothetical protein
MHIVFTDVSKNVPEIFYPQPSKNIVPEWYKDMPSYINGEKKPIGDGQGTGTIKRCMPVFDAISSGYIIKTHADLYISKKLEKDEFGVEKQITWYEWSSAELISFHDSTQATTYPGVIVNKIPKFMSPWSIETPKGYSVMVLQPLHRELETSILPGIVDTDKYNNPINFPFILSNPNFEGLIPAGTPIAQIIPFKRDKWSIKFGNDKNIEKTRKTFFLLRSKMFDSYKIQFRQPKEYL